MTDTPAPLPEIQPERRLRVSHIEIRPVLIWDDGDEMTPGPPLNTANVPLSVAKSMLDGLPDEVRTLEKQLVEGGADAR